MAPSASSLTRSPVLPKSVYRMKVLSLGRRPAATVPPLVTPAVP
ncbi:hypothetical protein AAGT00_31175 [Streptomyces cavourensis]